MGLNSEDLFVSRFLGGSSGLNGTVCIRGMKQDYDDWEMDGWSGAEFFQYMSKARDKSRLFRLSTTNKR
jgi:choline dehydrogenase-like flavoprotein